MLLDQTDDEHGLSMNQIIEKLAEHEIQVEHKTVYSDLKTLRSFGLDIVKRGGARSTEYAIGERSFRNEELMMLVAAVESCKFLTQDMVHVLVEKLKRQASTMAAKNLQGSIQVCNGAHMENRRAFYYLLTIIDAINNKHQISFAYTHRTLKGFEKRPVRADVTRTATPICVLYSEGNCYVATYNQEKDDIYIYRIDHMQDVQELEIAVAQSSKIAAFNPEKFAIESFGMFGGKVCTVTLLVHESCLNAVCDRFGEGAHMINVRDDWAKNEWTRAIIDVIPSPQFYGWVSGFNGYIEIESPAGVVDEYRAQLMHILEGVQK